MPHDCLTMMSIVTLQAAQLRTHRANLDDLLHTARDALENLFVAALHLRLRTRGSWVLHWGMNDEWLWKNG